VILSPPGRAPRGIKREDEHDGSKPDSTRRRRSDRKAPGDRVVDELAARPRLVSDVDADLVSVIRKDALVSGPRGDEPLPLSARLLAHYRDVLTTNTDDRVLEVCLVSKRKRFHDYRFAYKRLVCAGEGAGHAST